jgi:hypothetical protein
MTRHRSIALALFALVAAPGSAAAAGLPWRQDDYDGARAEAQRRHVPILAEIWAPW